MTTYLVNRTSHRLDGTTVVNCITQGNHRQLNLRLCQGSSDTAILAGSAYDFTWHFKLGIRNVTAVQPATIPNCFWPVLVSKNFYTQNLTLPKKLKSVLLRLAAPLQAQLLSSLSKHDATLFEGYLPEPYLSELTFHVAESQQRQVILSAMQRAGVSTSNSETIFAIYGKESLQVISDPMKLRQFQSLPAPDSLHNGHRLIEWLDRNAKCGSTFANEQDIPPGLRNQIDWCKSKKLIIVGKGKVQLVTHAIQQRLLRQQIQRVCEGFFPRYAPSEIEYAYSRYSGLMGTLDGQDFFDSVSTAINSRISYVSSGDLPSTLKYMSELSAIIQLLGAQTPYIIVRSKVQVLRYSKLDIECKLISELSHIDENYRTLIAPDLHHYTIIEYHSLFSSLTNKDRLVAISDLTNSTPNLPGTQVARQLSKYFPNPIISARSSNAVESKVQSLPFELPVITNLLRSSKNLTAICDNVGLTTMINSSSANRTTPIVMVTPDKTFRKNDRIVIQPLPSTGIQPFFCTLLSTNDKGIYVESHSGSTRISSLTLAGALSYTGFAMPPEVACSIGIKEALLVCKDSIKAALSRMLIDYGMNIKVCFTYQDTEYSLSHSPCIQRITPRVE